MFTMAKPNPGTEKPKRTIGPTDKIRVALDIYAALNFVATRRKVDVAELVDPLLRQWAITEHAIESKKMAEENRKREG